MGRPPRLELAGVPLHVVQRGNNRAACFFNDVDPAVLSEVLAGSRGGTRLLIARVRAHDEPRTPPSHAVGGRRYVRIINNIHGRTGSSLTDSEEYLLACHRYIEPNPVRAGMVAQAADYAWSSHRYFTGARTDPAITEHPLFLGLAADKEQCQESFAALSNERLEPTVVEEIRLALNTDSALGSDNFMDDAEALLGRSAQGCYREIALTPFSPRTAGRSSRRSSR